MKRPRTFGQRDRRERQRDYEAERRRSKPWRRWYSLKLWANIRDAQLAEQPMCERCLAKDKIESATVVNHKIPHRGIWEIFIRGPFESLCKRCHDSIVQAEERAAAREGGSKV